MNKFLKSLSIFSSFAFLFSACEEKSLEKQSPEVAFAAAKKFYDDKHFEESTKRLREFSAHFPYSQYAQEADLLVAHGQFSLEKWGEAQASYGEWARLHPSHPQRSFALHRQALSLWNMAPQAESREQDRTSEALHLWDKLILEYPMSPYISEALPLMKEGKKRLEKRDMLVCKFYEDQKDWPALAYTALSLLEKTDLPSRELLIFAQKGLDKSLPIYPKTDKERESHLLWKNYSLQDMENRIQEIHQRLATKN